MFSPPKLGIHIFDKHHRQRKKKQTITVITCRVIIIIITICIQSIYTTKSGIVDC